MTIQLLALSILGPHPQEQQVLGFLSQDQHFMASTWVQQVTCICDLPRESDWGAPEAEMLVDVALCLALAICLHLLEFCLYLSGKNKSSLRAEVHYWLIYTSVHDYWSLQKSHSMTKIFQVIVVFMSVKRFVFWNDKSTILKSCTFTTIQITWKCNKMSGIKIACKKNQ